ncbi:MAG: SPFH domain-containing protein [Anaerolineales bacterium]
MTETNQQAPLAQIFSLKDLPGRIGKSIQVPPGRLGIAIYPDGKTRTFQPGERQLLSILERLRGKGVGLQCGYIPAQPPPACLRLEYLLSGDGELLDALLVCTVEISDPARFFHEIVVPRGGLPDATLELDAQSAQLTHEALGALTAQYTAGDLVSGRLDARLLPQITASLETQLSGQGLALKGIRLLTISRSENRAIVAEKAQALRERLQDVDLQRKLAEIETQSQLDEFMQQVAPEMKDVARASVPESAAAPKGGVAAALRSWLASAGGQAQRIRSKFEELLRRKQQEKGFTLTIPKVPARTRPIWEEPIWGIIFTLLLAILITAITPILPNWLNKIDILIATWGAAIPILIEKSFELLTLREEFEEENWAKRGHQYLDNLTGNDRPWADQVVREQCVRELRHIQQIVSEIRSSEYQRGNQDFALTIKQTLERNLGDWLDKLQRDDYAKAPYVTDLNISNHAWKQMLDKDEDLILHINALSEWAGRLQQESLLAQLKPEDAAKLNAEISRFGNLFFQRGRAMQAPDVEPTKK